MKFSRPTPISSFAYHAFTDLLGRAQQMEYSGEVYMAFALVPYKG